MTNEDAGIPEAVQETGAELAKRNSASDIGGVGQPSGCAHSRGWRIDQLSIWNEASAGEKLDSYDGWDGNFYLPRILPRQRKTDTSRFLAMVTVTRQRKLVPHNDDQVVLEIEQDEGAHKTNVQIAHSVKFDVLKDDLQFLQAGNECMMERISMKRLRGMKGDLGSFWQLRNLSEFLARHPRPFEIESSILSPIIIFGSEGLSFLTGSGLESTVVILTKKPTQQHDPFHLPKFKMRGLQGRASWSCYMKAARLVLPSSGYGCVLSRCNVKSQECMNWLESRHVLIDGYGTVQMQRHRPTPCIAAEVDAHDNGIKVESSGAKLDLGSHHDPRWRRLGLKWRGDLIRAPSLYLAVHVRWQDCVIDAGVDFGSKAQPQQPRNHNTDYVDFPPRAPNSPCSQGDTTTSYPPLQNPQRIFARTPHTLTTVSTAAVALGDTVSLRQRPPASSTGLAQW
ncbi:hypothetical protein F5146DRAFT_1006683 [Armillaria mellea]|nr:hypothetical protein F5146DRAFT_1006683 [Armillaria mellea]